MNYQTNLRTKVNIVSDRKLEYTSMMSNPKKPRNNCLTCNIQTSRSSYKYCSIRCQRRYQYVVYIKRWKEGTESGLKKSLGIVSNHIKQFLREKYKNKCCICNWAEENPFTAQVPLVADHIDGNWKNNVENNLRLICPNCDSLTATYSGLNRNRGRKNRSVSKRAQQSKILYSKPV